jgi:predicted CXXCH cytochrome family protein
MTEEPEMEEEPLADCLQCHTRVPERTIVRMNGKQLCYGCAGAWFGTDDDEEEGDNS